MNLVHVVVVFVVIVLAVDIVTAFPVDSSGDHNIEDAETREKREAAPCGSTNPTNNVGNSPGRARAQGNRARNQRHNGCRAETSKAEARVSIISYRHISREMPQIVVDSALDDDNNKQFPLKDVVQTINTLSINSPPIKYLTPPARTRHRSTTESVSTVSTHSSNSSLKGKNKKLSRSVSDCDDNVSIGGCSIGGLGSVFAADDDYHSDISAVNRPIDSAHMTARLVSFLSVMYALVIIVTAALICVYDLDTADSDINHIFMSGMTLIGFAWLIFLHWDIHRYKRWAVEYLRPESGSTVDDNCSKRSNFDDTMSITTAVIFNSINQSQPQWPSPS
ncbi:unnamed protein product, partial [Medioppia subpectinata]